MGQTAEFKRINKLRKKYNLSWSELAAMADIPVSSWMTGLPAFSPTDEELAKLAPVLGVTFNYLKTGKN